MNFIFILVIKICMNLLNRYQDVYNTTVQSMEESANESAWNCSQMFIFGIMTKFLNRLKKV